MQARIGKIDVGPDDRLELRVRGLEIILAAPQGVVGVEAYLAKGGAVVTDLFAESQVPFLDMEANQDEFAAQLQAKQADGAKAELLDGYLVLPADALRQKELVFYARNAANFANRTRLGDALDTAVQERRAALAGVDPNLMREVLRGIDLRVVNERGESERGRVMLAFSLLMILYITILVYGITVLRGVTEEKQSRIIEVLLASVRPFDLLLGKVIGIGCVGLTQYVVWASSALLLGLVTAGPMLAVSGMEIPRVSVALMVFFVVYYLLGYLMYATLYAMVGAIVSNEDDAQQMQMPITMTFVTAIVLATFVMQNPSGRAATLLSLFPFFSPALMFLRIAFDAAPGWQIALSIVLMIGTILGCVWIAAKIYRVGVLMHGKRPSLPELMRWLRYS